MVKNSWSDETLIKAVLENFSIRRVIIELGLIPAGGNYVQVNKRIKLLGLDISHFTGKIWNKGKKIPTEPVYKLSEILVQNGNFQSFSLKRRLFKEGIKTPECEECGWSKMSSDGRVPVELDHINGDRWDNRLENLRILCPNCHSLKPTHRGRNKYKNARVL